MTAEDLKTYKVRVEEPVKIHLSNGEYDVYSTPTPSSGPVLLHILSILDGKSALSNIQ